MSLQCHLIRCRRAAKYAILFPGQGKKLRNQTHDAKASNRYPVRPIRTGGKQNGILYHDTVVYPWYYFSCNGILTQTGTAKQAAERNHQTVRHRTCPVCRLARLPEIIPRIKNPLCYNQKAIPCGAAYASQRDCFFMVFRMPARFRQAALPMQRFRRRAYC